MEIRAGNAWRRRRRTRIVCGPSVITSMDRAYNKDTTSDDFGVENDDDFLPSRAGSLRGCSSVYNIERLRVARWWHWVIVLIFAPTLDGVGFSGGCWVARGPLSSSVKLLTYRYCRSMRRRSSSSRSSRSGDNVKTLAVMSQSLHYSTAAFDAFDAFDTLSPGSGKEEMKGGNGDRKRLLGEIWVCAPSTNKAIIEDTVKFYFVR